MEEAAGVGGGGGGGWGELGGGDLGGGQGRRERGGDERWIWILCISFHSYFHAGRVMTILGDGNDASIYLRMVPTLGPQGQKGRY